MYEESPLHKRNRVSYFTKYLRNRCGLPPEVKVKVELCDRDYIGDELEGYCQYMEEGHYLIRIPDDLTVSHIALMLVHEFAHVVQWEECDENVADHGEEFGRIYSRLYQILVDPD